MKRRIVAALQEFAQAAGVELDLPAFLADNALEGVDPLDDWAAGFRHERDEQAAAKAARQLTCPKCHAKRGERCIDVSGFTDRVHPGRRAKVT